MSGEPTLTGDPSFDDTTDEGPGTDSEGAAEFAKEGTEDNPFACGLFQTVTDVEWLGLAVEFYDGEG